MFLLSTTFASAPPSQEAPDDTLDALWAALSHEPLAGADAARLREIFHPDARVFALRFEDGQPRVVVRSAEEFIARQAEAEKTGFYEREIFRSVRTYGDFAHALSTVESRTDRDAPQASFVGVNSLQLAREGGRWRILSLYFSQEKPGVPIPADWRAASFTYPGPAAPALQ